MYVYLMSVYLLTITTGNKQIQLMQMGYNMSIKDYGHRFRYNVQLWSRKELLNKVRVGLRLGSGKA